MKSPIKAQAKEISVYAMQDCKRIHMSIYLKFLYKKKNWIRANLFDSLLWRDHIRNSRHFLKMSMENGRDTTSKQNLVAFSLGTLE